MAVYVDDAFAAGDWGRWSGGGHLQADTAAELHAMAARLEPGDAWFHARPGRAERDHYDITAAGRRRAIALGAVPESWRAGVLRRRALARAGRPGERPPAAQPGVESM